MQNITHVSRNRSLFRESPGHFPLYIPIKKNAKYFNKIIYKGILKIQPKIVVSSLKIEIY